MKTELIINQTAGGGKVKKLLPEILENFKKIDIPYHISHTTCSGGATQLAQHAADNGAELIVSVGGDGTINEIINGIMASKNQPPLGIIPAGWANDFIKSTAIPNDIYQACQVIKKGNSKKIDLGYINQQTYFANVCGIGFDADITALANRIKTEHPNWKSLSAYVYVFAAIRKLLSPIPSFKVKITVDNQVMEKDILFIAIANGKVEGGKFNIAPDAEIDDSLLDIWIIQKMSRVRCLQVFPKAIKGTHKDVPEVIFLRGKNILIEASKPINAQVAGEILIPQEKYHIQIQPKKLNLLTI